MNRIDLNPEPETSKLRLKKVITRGRGGAEFGNGTSSFTEICLSPCFRASA